MVRPTRQPPPAPLSGIIPGEVLTPTGGMAGMVEPLRFRVRLSVARQPEAPAANAALPG